MDTTTVVVIVVVLVVLVALAVIFTVARPQLRRRRLQEKFGPEYDRALRDNKDHREAERELADRERRHSELELRPLSEESRAGYAHRWARVQEEFVDAPGAAAARADGLITDLMAERGYPTEGYEQQAADLSVSHSRVLGHYRAAHAISLRSKDNPATTEELREAMVHYRALFEDLLEHSSG